MKSIKKEIKKNIISKTKNKTELKPKKQSADKINEVQKLVHLL
jgi:hypothetical protein